MTITALATVRTIVPGTWTAATPLQDIADITKIQSFVGPIETVQHLTTTQGLERAGGQMNAGLFALIEHTRATQVVYEFAELPSEEWAEQANAIFLMGDQLRNIDGEDLLKPENQYSVPYHPDARMRASRIRADLGVLGINVLDDLPPVRSEHELKLRDPREVARRACALIVASEIAVAWHHNENIIEPIQHRMPDAFTSFSPREQALIDAVRLGDRSPATMEEVMQLSWSSKAAQPLMHVLGAIELPAHMTGRATPRPDDLAGISDAEVVDVAADWGSTEFIKNFTTLSEPAEVCDLYEYVRSIRWVAVDETLRPEDPHHVDERTGSALMEWHKALAWLTDPGVPWDDTPTHT
ncbi:DUF4272 domain-containing protein [Corynebacterium sp. H130]|uniref:DUF4272 domain-containing protein n=1 Tax=Corynebacterium sp. H130 TaxID=3133444 RepID=UPI0030AD7EB3